MVDIKQCDVVSFPGNMELLGDTCTG